MSLQFTPPDGSTWELDPVHQPRPWSRFMTEVYAEPFARGFAAGTAEHGLLLDRRRIVFLHGFGYLSLDLVAPEQISARIEQLITLFDRKPWRAALASWDAEVKPAAIAANRAFAAIDPATLDDAALLAHLGRLRTHLADMVFTHMRFTIAALLPVGDYLAHVTGWTGCDAATALAMLRGSSQVSSGRAAGIDRVAAAVAASATASAALARGLDALLADPDAGPATRAWLDEVGWRPLDGMDVADACAIELPDLLARTIVAALEPPPAPAAPTIDIPAEHRATYDALLAEARMVYRLRDERGVYTDVWAAGLTRRALLELGRRLGAKLARPDHVVDASWDELRALLAGAGPSADELAARARFRTTHTAADAPPLLGPPPQLPPLDALPPPARRAVIAVMTAIGALFAEAPATPTRALVKGVPGASGSYDGVARLIRDPSELGRLRAGDVLVTSSTSEAFNIALPLCGAIVTDRGGALSHAAIVARELGIPCVAGTRTATSSIRDGARIRVNGSSGEITLL